MISQKGIYGLTSGIISTAILQPFQNVKMALMLPPKALEHRLNQNFFSNIGRASRYIFELDGIKGFYKGLVAATLKAATGCYIYFSILRFFQNQDHSASKNFLLSSMARITSAILTNPLSIIQTRFQLADFHEYSSVQGAMRNIYIKEGLTGFFSGTLASCLKEGFFAGLYYMFYQELKGLGCDKLTSGLLGGMISTAITHPFQIIRARLQTIGLTQSVQLSEHLILGEIRTMFQNGGWFHGLTPRLLKKPLGNTITFIIFQLIEEIKKKQQTLS